MHLKFCTSFFSIPVQKEPSVVAAVRVGVLGAEGHLVGGVVLVRARVEALAAAADEPRVDLGGGEEGEGGEDEGAAVSLHDVLAQCGTVVLVLPACGCGVW